MFRFGAPGRTREGGPITDLDGGGGSGVCSWWRIRSLHHSFDRSARAVGDYAARGQKTKRPSSGGGHEGGREAA